VRRPGLAATWGATLGLLAALPLAAALGPRYGGHLSVGVLDLPDSLSPADAQGRDAALALGLVHETLLHVEAGGAPSPALALRWASAAEGREWTLWLRTGLRFHDGSPLTAADAARSIRRFLRGPSPVAAALARELDGGDAFRDGSSPELPGLSAPDPERLLLRLQSSRPLAFAPLAAIGAAVTGPGGAGAGPFLPSLEVPGRRLSLVPFASHWAGRPYLDELELLVGTSADALAADLAAGRLDVVAGGPGTSRLASSLLLVLDPSRPPFDRPEAREAADAALEAMQLQRLLPGSDPTRVLLAPSLLPALSDRPAPVAALRLDGQVSLAVERDVAPLVSQRVVALLSEAGLRVAPSASQAVPAAPGVLRLLAWSPQVPEAGLALRELAALAGDPPAVAEALDAAERDADPDRRRARLHQAELALRHTRLLLPVGLAPVSASVRPGVHGPLVDDAGRIRLDSTWLEP
jgi:Bacterial extracellular solute-binding proteins, family 5 Middle